MASMLVRLQRVAMLAILATTVAACTSGAPGVGPASLGAAAQRSATGFLDTYVRPDGRVIRPDQGGDTVSEGQAYGMLLAEIAGKPATFGRIWQWTRKHLQHSDGLFAYHANAAGRMLSPNPASDADVLIAWALLRYDATDAAARHREGRQVAAAVLAREVTAGPGRMRILTAGPWATDRPASLNPSYWALPALTGLAQLTGDRQWQRLANAAVALTSHLTRGGRNLPPDWARLTGHGKLVPSPSPDRRERQVEYGLAAQRTIPWFTFSCYPRARALARRWWRLLRRPARQRALALRPDGDTVSPDPAPLPLVAAASAAEAAGLQTASRRLLHRAAAQQHRHPTYYGGAWTALGLALFSGALASPC
jgi:endoglucanase